MAGPVFVGKVVMDPVAVAQFLRSRNGPVLRQLIVLGNQVKTGAQKQVGVHELTPGERRARKPGTLRDSIVTRIVERAEGPAVMVGSEDPIALMHHEGTRPHVIRARRAPMLVFYWRRVGRVVAFKKVNHPGTQPNHYLTDPLEALTLR
jgi:hypothetical protein